MSAIGGYPDPKRTESSRYEPHPTEAQPPVPLPRGVFAPTVKELLRTLQAVDLAEKGWAMPGQRPGIFDEVRFSLDELRCMKVALREATDRRIEAEIRKLDRATAGARLARKLIASVAAARRAARLAWKECK